MDTQQERLSHLDRALSNGENICSALLLPCLLEETFHD